MNIREPDFDREPPSDELLAGEYVLGVLDAHARRQVQARASADAGFAAQVADWEYRLAPLVDAIEPVEVPAHVWPRIRRQLGWSPVEGARPGLWNDVRTWRVASVAGFAAAAVLAVVVVSRPPQQAAPLPTPVVVAPTPPAPTPAEHPMVTLASAEGQPLYMAVVDTRDHRVTVMPMPSGPEMQGRVPELWLIPAGEAPRSLGFVRADRAMEIPVPEPLRAELVAGSTLAISLEPPSQTPHAAPTGPVVATGGIQVI